MAVVSGDPLDIALDEIARLVDAAPSFALEDQLMTALSCAALWRVVFNGAMRDGDGRLAAVAAEQIRSAHHAYRCLVSISDADLTALEAATFKARASALSPPL